MRAAFSGQRWRGLLAALVFLAVAQPLRTEAALIDVELADLPVTDALKLVARQAGKDIQVDESLETAQTRPDKLPWGPPTVKLQLKQVAADQVLESLVGAYGLVVDKSRGPELAKLRFAKDDELVFKSLPRPLPSPLKDQRKTPLLFFDEAPVLQVLQTLALQSRLNLIPSHELMTGTNAQGVPWQELVISFKIRNVSSQQALEAALDASGLVVDWSALGQVGIIYPASRFKVLARPPSNPPGTFEKTDFTLAELGLEDFVQLIGTQMNVNLLISTAARQTTTGPDKQPLMQSSVSISQKGITPLAALQEILKSKGLEFRWNMRAEVGVVDLIQK